MNTVTRTLGELVESAIYQLEGPRGRGAPLVLAADIAAADTSITLKSGPVLSPTDVVEFGPELLLVTSKTSDNPPEYQVSRGYYGTTALPHLENDAGVVNPEFTRKQIAEAVKRCFSRLEALGLPLWTTELMFPVPSIVDDRLMVLEVPEETRTVLRVQFEDLTDVPRWSYVPAVSRTDYSTGKIVRLPRGLNENTPLYVTFRVPYRWSSFPSQPDESSTIEILEGAEDLPSLYTTAFLLSSREVSRGSIDRAEEWPRGEPQRGGSSNAQVNRAWQEFYRALDEARRLEPPVLRRSYYRRVR